MKKFICIVLLFAIVLSFSVAVFADAENYQNFFCIGDSIVCASSLDNIVGAAGFRKGSTQEILADYYNITNGYFGGHSGIRPQELRVILEDDYAGDDFTARFLNNYCGLTYVDLKNMSSEYIEELAKADFITIELGSNNILGRTSMATHDFVEKHVPGEESSVSNIINIILSEDKILTSISDLNDLALRLVRSVITAEATFADGWDNMIRDIRDINPSAKIVVIGVYNPAAFKVHSKIGGIITPEICQLLANPFINDINYYICLDSPYHDQYTFVDVPDIDLVGSTDGMHPHYVGYQYIADCVIEALDGEGAIDAIEKYERIQPFAEIRQPLYKIADFGFNLFQ